MFHVLARCSRANLTSNCFDVFSVNCFGKVFIVLICILRLLRCFRTRKMSVAFPFRGKDDILFHVLKDELLGLADSPESDPIFKSHGLNMDIVYRTGETQQVGHFKLNS